MKKILGIFYGVLAVAAPFICESLFTPENVRLEFELLEAFSDLLGFLIIIPIIIFYIIPVWTIRNMVINAESFQERGVEIPLGICIGLYFFIAMLTQVRDGLGADPALSTGMRTSLFFATLTLASTLIGRWSIRFTPKSNNSRLATYFRLIAVNCITAMAITIISISSFFIAGDYLLYPFIMAIPSFALGGYARMLYIKGYEEFASFSQRCLKIFAGSLLGLFTFLWSYFSMHSSFRDAFIINVFTGEFSGFRPIAYSAIDTGQIVPVGMYWEENGLISIQILFLSLLQGPIITYLWMNFIDNPLNQLINITESIKTDNVIPLV